MSNRVSSFFVQLEWSFGSSSVQSMESIQVGLFFLLGLVMLLPFYSCDKLFPTSEGILEDYVVEGIDRKDVFFYQVRSYLHLVQFLCCFAISLSILLFQRCNNIVGPR